MVEIVRNTLDPKANIAFWLQRCALSKHENIWEPIVNFGIHPYETPWKFLAHSYGIQTIHAKMRGNYLPIANKAQH